MRIQWPLIAAATVLSAGTCALAQQPAPPPEQKDHVAAVKESLKNSMVTLRQYEWVETTAVSMKGEEKSRTQNRCVYGAEGKVVKTPLVSAPAGDSKSPRGVRGKVVANKKEEISDSMKEAIALVKQYVPPDPARLQAAKDAGRVTLNPPDAQGNMTMVVKDYLKTGDSLTIALNAATDRLGGIKVATFTDKAKDAVNLNVTMGAFPDGTVYAGTIGLEVKAQNMTVAIDNSGYQKVRS